MEERELEKKLKESAEKSEMKDFSSRWGDLNEKIPSEGKKSFKMPLRTIIALASSLVLIISLSIALPISFTHSPFTIENAGSVTPIDYNGNGDDPAGLHGAGGFGNSGGVSHSGGGISGEGVPQDSQGGQGTEDEPTADVGNGSNISEAYIRNVDEVGVSEIFTLKKAYELSYLSKQDLQMVASYFNVSQNQVEYPEELDDEIATKINEAAVSIYLNNYNINYIRYYLGCYNGSYVVALQDTYGHAGVVSNKIEIVGGVEFIYKNDIIHLFVWRESKQEGEVVTYND